MKNLLKNFVSIISVFLLAVIHFGSPTSAKDLVIMTSLPSMEFPFFVHMQKQLDQEARRIGGIKIMAADGQNRVPKQTADVESAIIQGVDGIIISPIDVNAMAPALQQAIDAGIPVVTVDRYVGGVPDIYAHVGADNVDKLQSDFKNFYSQYDKRRGKDFANTFGNKMVTWYEQL